MISKQFVASVLNLVPRSKRAGFFFAAKELYIDIIGVSFHVGSGCTETLVHTISDTGCVFVMGAEAGFNTVSA